MIRAMRVVATAAWLMMLAGLSRGGEVNLLTNGGFEEGLAGWTPAPGHELVTDEAAAHSGTRCLTGEVTEPRQHLTLARTVRVRPGNLYRFEIWARATNRTKLVLWVRQPKARRRQLVAAWPRLPGTWRRFAAPLSAESEGMLELQIIAPSSHNEPPGRIWVDDVALYETPMPPLVDVSERQGFNDEPAMARAEDGALVVAWNSFRHGADSLQVARYLPQGEGVQQAGAWQVLGGKGTYLLGLRAVPAGKAVAVLTAAEVEGNWDLYAVPVDADGPGTPWRLTADARVDVKPAAAWHQGALWVAWEGNRNGGRQVFLASVRDGKPSAPEAVSEADASSYGPSVAVLASGEVAVAWHAFREGNYDVYLRRRSPAGAWSAVRRLTQAPQVDRHPELLARGEELWVVYEHAEVGRGKPYRIGATDRRRLLVGKVTAEGLLAPQGLDRSPLAGRCEAARAAFDEAGRLWVAFLRPRLPRSGWDAFLTCYAGTQWQAAAPLTSAKGMDRPPALVIEGGRARVAVHTDTIPRTWSEVDKTDDARSDISLVTVSLAEAPEAAPMALQPLLEPTEPCEAAAIRIARGEDTPRHSISYRGKTLTLYFGDLHEHSDISVCNRVGDQAVDECYQHLRDIARYDFACVTDHGYNLNPYLWATLGKLARVHHDPGRFLPFLGEEWTSSFEKYSAEHPYGYYGHRNLILADPYFPRWWNARNGQTPAQVWTELRKMKANFVHIPHQLADTGNVPTDWSFVDEAAQPVAEIFQIRGSYEYKGAPREAGRTTPEPGTFLQDAWARGIVIGVIASPDHGGGYGKAAVYAPELSREAILDALRARRCYGTTAAKILLDVRVGGHLMGEKVAPPAGKSVEVQIRVQAPQDIARVEVCRNNRFLHTHEPTGRTAEVTFTDRDPLPGRSFYYVRVMQKDGEIAWSSPVWFGAE